MRVLRNFNYFAVLLLTVFIFYSCKDTNDAIKEVAPEIPDLSEAKLSFDFFKAKVNSSLTSSTGENFNIAANLTNSMEGLTTGFSSLPESFMVIAENIDATNDGAIWTWSYTGDSSEGSVTIRLTAEVKLLQTNWAMYISSSSQEVTFDNYKIFDGFIKNTSNEGQWSFYSYFDQSSSPAMTYEWDIENENNGTFSLTFSEASYAGLYYVKASPENTLTLTDREAENTVIYWNETTGMGYIDFTNLETVCWDGAGNNVACTGF